MSSPGGWWQDDDDEELASPPAAEPETAAAPVPIARSESRSPSVSSDAHEEQQESAPEEAIEPVAPAEAFHDPSDFKEALRSSEAPPSWQYQEPAPPAWPGAAEAEPPGQVNIELMPISEPPPAAGNPNRPTSTAAGKPILQPAAVQFDTRTVRGKGRGRNTGRGRQIVPEKSSKIFGIDKKRLHKPYFIVIITFIDIVVFAWEIALNKGIEPPKLNPMLGPDSVTLLKMGAKYGPLIKDGEWWRLITPIFLHVGFVHLFLNLLTQLAIGWSLEKNYGFYRIVPIYFLSGIMGNIFATVFVPCGISVGASGALFGFIGVLFVDLIQNWKSLRNPVCNLMTLLITTLISFAIGLMPFLDNWVHIGGFICGLIAAVIILPNLYFVTKCCRRTKIISIIICVPLLLFMFVGGFILIYKAVPADSWCNWCRYISCLPVGKWKNECTRSALNDDGSCY